MNFTIIVSAIANAGGDPCSGGGLVTTATTFEKIPKSTLDAILAYWHWIVGAAVGIAFFTIIFVVAWRFGAFDKVRMMKMDEEPIVAEEEEDVEADK